jgi:hypothetical protein
MYQMNYDIYWQGRENMGGGVVVILVTRTCKALLKKFIKI